MERDEDLDSKWELDPTDPSHPDWDLSEAAPYSDWEPSGFPIARWLVIGVSLLLVLAMLVPSAYWFVHYLSK